MAVGVVRLEPGEVEAVVGDVGEEEVGGWRRNGLEGSRRDELGGVGARAEG